MRTIADMDNAKKIGLTAVAVVALGALTAGGAALAASATDGPGGYGYGYGGHGGRGPGGPGGAGHDHTPVTGAEETKVSAAVTAKFPGVTVEEVRKDPDGSYDVRATQDDAPVFYEVSADLATITERTGGPGRGGPGGHGEHGGPGDRGPGVPGERPSDVPTPATPTPS